MTTIVIKTIYYTRKSSLFDKDSLWVKRDNQEFDVTMGIYNSAELCELVSLHLLDLLTKESGTITRTGITCKKIPCYMSDSPCR